jgi:hypothetical protein
MIARRLSGRAPGADANVVGDAQEGASAEAVGLGTPVGEAFLEYGESVERVPHPVGEDVRMPPADGPSVGVVAVGVRGAALAVELAL